MEKLDLYDENREKLGETINRGEEVPDGKFRLCVHVCIFNSNGEMLIQRRSAIKSTWANMWDVTMGGGAQAGEDAKQAATRELQEELCIDLDLSDQRAFFTLNFGSGFDDFFLINQDVDISKVKFRDGEVQAVKWADKNQILNMIRSGEFLPYKMSLIELIFAMHNGSRGVFC